MDDIGSSLRQQILEANVDMFCAHDVVPTALSVGLVPVDIDVTPFDNSKSCKEGVWKKSFSRIVCLNVEEDQ